jgi:hypothetical protein
VLPFGIRLETIEERHVKLAVAFLCEPLRDLLACQTMVIVEVHDH